MMPKVVAGGADSLLAVIVAVPGPTAVNVTVAPLEVLTELDALTVTTALLLELQLTVRSDNVLPFASLGVAVKTCVAPMVIGVDGTERVTVATGAGLTVIVGVGLELTDSLVAVMVAVPSPTAVTVAGEPLALTVSTAVLLDTHVMVRPVRTWSLASLVSAVSC